MTYLTQIIRNFRKYFITNLLRILILSLGLGTFFILILYLVNETSYDKFNKNYKDLFIVNALVESENIEKCFTPLSLGQEILETSPHVIEKTTFSLFGKAEIQVNDNWSPRNIKVLGADPSFTKLFSFKYLLGDPDNWLKNNNSVVISSDIQNTYFPDQNPVGQIIKFKKFGQVRDLVIEGIFEIPSPSSIQTDIFISNNLITEFWKIVRPNYDENSKDFNSFSSMTFLLKNEDASQLDIENNMSGINDKYSKTSTKTKFNLIALEDLYYHSKHILPSGNKNKVRMFAVIALIIIFLTYSNFLLLSLAINLQDIKKYCTMKVYGAGVWNIFILEFIKIILLTIISLVGALFISKFLLPLFNQYSGVNIQLKWLTQYQYFIKILPIILGFTLIASLFIGIYSSLFDTTTVVQNTISGSKINSKTLILVTTIQVLLFFVLLSTSIIINRQTKLLFTKDTGFSKEDMVVIQLNRNQRKNYDILKNNIEQLPFVKSVTGSKKIFLLDDDYSQIKLFVDGKPKHKVLTNLIEVDNNFISTMNIDMVVGRDFFEDERESKWSIIVNEEFVRSFHLENPIGTVLSDNANIIGVVKDFHFENIKSKIEPLIINQNPKGLDVLLIKINSAFPKTLKEIKAEWQKVFPENNFNYLLYDEILNQIYKQDINFYNLVSAFTLIAIIISSIGMYTISLFYASRRISEIAIRKILGANTSSMHWSLNNKLLQLTGLSLVVSIPFTIFITNRWLMTFAYKISINAWDFIYSIVIGMTIILLITSISIRKIIRTNLVEILRNE